MRNYPLFLVFAICICDLSVRSQARAEEGWRDAEPKTVTLYSRAKYKDKFEGYGKSTFSFKHGVRSEVGRGVTRNNYELQYGGISLNGDSDWFKVTMVTDDCSQVQNLGELNWSDILDVPYLPTSLKPQKGIRMPSKTETFEQSSNGQVTRVMLGHMYVLHSKDRNSDLYTLFRVEKLVPGDKVTISWKAVPSPEPL